MTEPGRLLGQAQEYQPMEDDNDVDAEGEDDIEIDPALLAGDAAKDEEQGSEADAEGEEIDDEELANITTRATSAAVSALEEQPEEDEEEQDDDADADAVPDDESDARSEESEADSRNSDSESESDAEEEWKAGTSAAEEVEDEVVDPNTCIFCGQDEENDPCPDYEEFLACAVCGDNAHPQCARNANSLSSDDDCKKWRCTTCVENGLEGDVTPLKDNKNSRRRTSAPKMARDLMPTGTKGDKIPDSHSVFHTLILDDDPMDGSRALRKRKATEESEPPTRSTRKRQNRASEAPSALSTAPKSSSPEAVRVAVPSSTNGVEEDDSDDDAPPTRPRRTRRSDKPLARVIHNEWISLIVAFNLDPAKLNEITRKRPNPNRWKKKQANQKKILPPPPPEPEPSHYPAIQSNFGAPLWAFHDGEKDESKIKPYGGILSETEANTEKTFPQAIDRKRFEDARLKAEEDWKQKTAAQASAQETSSKSKQSGPPSKIKCISFGGYEIDTWHAAPYPEEYSRNRVLYICEFCLKYMNSDFVAWRHKLKCPAKHPPGDEIYRGGNYSFFEVDGRKNPVYCQNLCLLAKLFLGSKTLYYDVEPFLFYVMTENDEFGCHFVGYFSKEKRPSSMNNVSCILVLPIHQRKGYGHMLIEFSYLLTKVEQKTGSPEKPLSDMGLVSYRGYWRLTLCYELKKQKRSISISQISERTGMTADDIVSALEGLRALVRDPVTKTYALRLDYKYFDEYIANYEKKKYPKIDPEKLNWVPFVMGRSSLSTYETGSQIHTVAQRDEGEEEEPEEGVQQALQNGDNNSAEGQAVDRTKDYSVALSPREVNNNNKQVALTPQPSFSPSQSFPSTPRANGHVPQKQSAASMIPATRFEVFPPMPGRQSTSTATSRPRRNRPFGSRRRTSTPNKRNNGGLPSPSLANGDSPAQLKRARSQLSQIVFNKDDDEDDDDADEGTDGQDKAETPVNGDLNAQLEAAADNAAMEIDAADEGGV